MNITDVIKVNVCHSHIFSFKHYARDFKSRGKYHVIRIFVFKNIEVQQIVNIMT